MLSLFLNITKMKWTLNWSKSSHGTTGTPIFPFIQPHYLVLIIMVSLEITSGKPFISSKKMQSIEQLKLSPEQLKAVKDMHYSWYFSATNALLGAVARELYLRMNKQNRRAFIKCLNRIEKDVDIQAGARCITAAIDNRLVKSPIYTTFQDLESVSFVQDNGLNQVSEPSDEKSFLQEENEKDERWHSNYERFIKLGNPIKPIRFTSRLRRIYNPNERKMRSLVKRHNTFRIDGQLKELMEETRQLDKQDQDLKIIKMNRVPSLIDPNEEFVKMAKSPVWTTSKMLTNFFRALGSTTPTKTKPWKETYKKLEQVQDMIEESTSKARYRHRMLDFVLGDNNPYRRRKPLTERIQGYLPESVQKWPLLKNFLNLLDVFSKHNGDVAYKILSPRFMPIVPDKKQIKHALSPSLFPMYNDDSPNSILPIPKMLKATGLSDNDRDAILELIMQSSGARSLVDKTLDVLEKAKSLGLADDITNITVYIRDLFTNLEKTFNSRQKREIKSRKYTFMTKDQLLMLFGPEGLYNTTAFPFSIDEYESWTESEKREALFNKIRFLAGEVPENDEADHIRRKRQTTLAPFAFAPSVLGIAILAPITLSPSIFSPSIFYPYIFSPPVLSPQIGNPMIFSPYFLGPNTMSAAIFNVYVFTPYVLSPNVMNPYIMSPLILSPFVLSPDLLSPTILSGGILTPSILSPSILSPTAFAADILSPTLLS